VPARVAIQQGFDKQLIIFSCYPDSFPFALVISL
jgi:hypothetical protein